MRMNLHIVEACSTRFNDGIHAEYVQPQALQLDKTPCRHPQRWLTKRFGRFLSF